MREKTKEETREGGRKERREIGRERGRERETEGGTEGWRNGQRKRGVWLKEKTMEESCRNKIGPRIGGTGPDGSHRS